MANNIRCGLIQAKNEVVSPAGGTDKTTIKKIADAMLAKH